MNGLKKWLAAGVPVLAAALLWCGCGMKPSAKSVLKSMQEAQKKVTAAEIQWNMNLPISISLTETGQDMTVTADAAGTTLSDIPGMKSYTKADVNVSIAEKTETIGFEAYTLQTEENQQDIYLRLMDQWLMTSQEISQPEDKEKADSEALALAFADACVLADEKADRDGEACYQLDAVLPAEELVQNMKTVSSWLETAGEEEDLLLEVFRGKAFHVTLYVRESDSLIREAAIELTDAIPEEDPEDASEEAEEKADGETEVSSGEQDAENTSDAQQENISTPLFSFASLDMEMSMSYPDSVDIRVPNEALEEAEDLDDLETMGNILSGEGNAGAYSAGSILGTLSNPVIIREFDKEDPAALICDEKDVRVRLLRVYTDGSETAYADFEVENHSSRGIELYSNGSAWNHVMDEIGLDVSVKAGESGVACLRFTQLKDLGRDPAELSVKLIASDLKTYDDVFTTDLVTVQILENGAEPELKAGGSIVFENDKLQVTAYPADMSQSYMSSLPLAIVNKTERDLSVSSGTITIGGEPVDAYVYGNLFKGSILYTSMDVYPSAGESAPELKDLHFTLEAVDASTYQTYLVTEEIVVP